MSTPPDTQIYINKLESEEQITREIILDTLRHIGVTAECDPHCRLSDAADYLRDQAKDRIGYLNAAHRIGAENTANARQEIAQLRADLESMKAQRDSAAKDRDLAKSAIQVTHEIGVDNTERAMRQVVELSARMKESEEQFRKAAEWNKLCELELANLRSLNAEIQEDHAKFESIRNGDLVSKIEQEAIPALKAAYARGHYCDMGDRCPGCMAGYALEAITGRKWTQEECESAALTPTGEAKL